VEPGDLAGGPGVRGAGGVAGVPGGQPGGGRGSGVARREVTWCPSGLADRPESVVLGVRSVEDGGVAYLAEPVPAADVVDMVPAGIEPRRILRFASFCESECLHRSGNACGLVDRITAVPVPEAPGASAPRCHLRARCKWWRQRGLDACRRCPAVTTVPLAADELGTLVADPATTREQLDAWFAAADR